MLTAEEELWLIVYYCKARSLVGEELHKVERRLLHRGLATVRDARSRAPTDPRQLYITPSSAGLAYVKEYLLLRLLNYLFDTQKFTEIEYLFSKLPMKRLPELLVCKNPDLRFRAEERMQALKNGTDRPTTKLSHYIP